MLFLSNVYTLPGLIGGMVSPPPTVEILNKALELAEVHEQNKSLMMRYTMNMVELGYPLLFSSLAITLPAFYWMLDALMGMRHHDGYAPGPKQAACAY